MLLLYVGRCIYATSKCCDDLMRTREMDGSGGGRGRRARKGIKEGLEDYMEAFSIRDAGARWFSFSISLLSLSSAYRPEILMTVLKGGARGHRQVVDEISPYWPKIEAHWQSRSCFRRDFHFFQTDELGSRDRS